MPSTSVADLGDGLVQLVVERRILQQLARGSLALLQTGQQVVDAAERRADLLVERVVVDEAG